MDLRPPTRSSVALAALLAAAVAVMVACGPVGGPGDETSPTSAASARVSPAAAAGASTVSLRVRGSDEVATAVLVDGAAGEAFARLLPLRLTMDDPLGHARVGRLPERLDLDDDVARTVDPDAGGIYSWPPTGAIAIVYDDLGPRMPEPGAVLIGHVTDGLDVLVGGGTRVEVDVTTP